MINNLQAYINQTMVKIPSGNITLRDDRINRQWVKEVQPFYLSKFLVTQALYHHITQKKPSAFKGKAHPVESVSWQDAILFCNALSNQLHLTPVYHIDKTTGLIELIKKANGYRLPTEAEWEFACKANVQKPTYGPLESIAWFKVNANGQTQPVGLKAPNAFGLFDMLGNVWEWCTDTYDETVYGSYRIFRGGGWSDEARGCLATNRRRSHPTAFKIDDLGFRIARNS